MRSRQSAGKLYWTAVADSNWVWIFQAAQVVQPRLRNRPHPYQIRVREETVTVKLQEWRDEYRHVTHIHLEIPDLDQLNVRLDQFDLALARECSAGSVADNLLWLQVLAHRIEESKATRTGK